MLLELDDARSALETDVSTALLKLLLGETEAVIVERGGTLGSATVRREGGSKHLFLGRQAASVTTVTETDYNVSTVLAANDYVLHFGGRVLERLWTGTNPRYWWGQWVDLTFVPVDDLARRKRIQLDLLKVELSYRGLIKSSSDGTEYSSSGVNDPDAYNREREAVLRALTPVFGVAV